MNVEKLTEDQAQQSVAFPVEVKVYRGGAQIIPSAATITVRDPDGTALVTAAAMTINATTGTLTYSLGTAYTADLGENYVLEVDYTASGESHQATFFFDVVLQRLRVTVTDDDLRAYYPQIGDELWAEEASYAGQIEEAFLVVKRLIKDKGKRPAMLIDGSQLRELVIVKAFEMIFFAFAKSADDIWWARHQKYAALFDQRFQSLRIKYDEDESGTIEDDETETFAQPRLAR